MNNCPICDKEFNNIPGGTCAGSTIITFCTSDTPYPHALHMERYLTYNSLNNNLNLPLPTMCTIICADAELTIQSWDNNKTPTRLILKYKDESFIFDKGDLSGLLDYSNLPKVISSIINNIVFS